MQSLDHKTHPYPSLIRKMKTYLELEGKLGPQPQLQPCTSTFLPDKISVSQKTLVPKKAGKKNRAKTPMKRRFKVRVIAQPMPTNPTLSVNPNLPAESNPTVVNNTVKIQMPVAKSAAMAATSIPVTVYNLLQGKFEGIPYPTGKPQEEEGPSAPSCNNSQEKQQPEAAVTATAPLNREDPPWPNTMPTSTKLFDARASWPIPPTEGPTVIKTKEVEKKFPPRLASIPYTLVPNKPQSNKPAEEECSWGPHCPICTNSTPNQKAENTEDW